MKKILAILVVLALSTSAQASSYLDKQIKYTKKSKEYNTKDIFTRNMNPVNYYVQTSNLKDLKDPKLINFGTKVTPVDEAAYQKKLKEDEKVYNSMVKYTNMYGVDFFKIYRIVEKIIRANNLDYTNWRITVRKNPDEINAYATDGNHININSALYDALYNNEDAFAFVIAHEMSHIILGHNIKLHELNLRLQKLNRYEGKVISKSRIYKEIRTMEYMADAEAVNLLIRAGYNPSKIFEIFNTLEALGGSNVKNLYSSHPIVQERYKNALDTLKVTDPNWVNEGKSNIYNSKVIKYKKSSDRVSIMLYCEKDPNKKYYEVEDIETKIRRVAYINYIKGDLETSQKYFYKLTDLDDSYVPYLYLSYINERLYKNTHEKKYLKHAQKALQKAYELNPNEKNVLEQKKDLENL